MSLSNSQVRFGTTRGLYERQAASQVLTTEHLVVLANLEERTTYYFIVSSMDPAGNIGTEIRWGRGEEGADDSFGWP